MADEEGMSFETAFTGLFGTNTNVEARLKAERRAGLTPKQRARKATRTIQINVRATAEIKDLVVKLKEMLDASEADVFEQAILAFAREKGISGGRS